MRDPYEVLGVARTADAGAIKSAYRKLAKKLHPDANKNDPKSANKFAELNTAYEILGDEAKRKQFNNGEIDADGKPKGFEGFGAGGPRGGFGGFGGQPGGQGGFESFSFGPEGFRRGGGARPGGGRAGGFEDILKDMFGGFGGGAGPGAGARGGFGGAPFQEDFGARQQGQTIAAAVTVSLADVATGAKQRVKLPTGKEIDVTIPKGIADGQQIRLKGQGLPGPGGAGDAIITVNIAPDSQFRREGDNLRLELPVTLYEAVLGDKVRVPTLDGAVQLAIPPGTSSGRVFRLKGKGMPAKDGHGDLLVTIRIALPEKNDPELEELMRKWRDAKPYDPRKE